MKEKREKNVRRTARKTASNFLDLTATNYKWFGLAILILVIGYFFLAQGPADSFMSLSLAPIILIIGYCVVVPYAIFWKAKKKETQS